MYLTIVDVFLIKIYKNQEHILPSLSTYVYD